jgi:hypothetical protein
MTRVHGKVKPIVWVAAIVGLYADLVHVIWKAGHLIELLLFAVLLGLYHLERNPYGSSQ